MVKIITGEECGTCERIMPLEDLGLNDGDIEGRCFECGDSYYFTTRD